MQNENAQHDHYNDEIDLADLVRSLWDGKWLVIGVTLLTMLLAVAYLMLVPKTYTGSLEIAALPSVKAEVYLELNGTAFIDIDEQKLLSLFIEDVGSNDGLEQFIKQHKYISQYADETDREFNFRLRSATYNFSLTRPSIESAKTYQPNWVLNIVTHSPEYASLVIGDALALSTSNTNNATFATFQRRLDEKARAIRFGLEDLELQAQRVVAQYETEKAARLAMLAEQSAIARSIDNSHGTGTGMVPSMPSFVVTTVGKLAVDNGSVSDAGQDPLIVSTVNSQKEREALYLRGYLAIEKELQILKSRVSSRPFIPELARIEGLKMDLKQDQTVVRANEIFAETPIGGPSFEAAIFDMASIEYKSKTNPMLVLALSVVLGGMLGIFVLLIRNAVVRKD